MAKTLVNLTDAEFAIVNEYIELFGITEDEALEQAINEGSISDNEGGNFQYKPEGFFELKFYKLYANSDMYKVNKALKKAKLPELFEEDAWHYNPVIVKTEDKKEYDLEKCTVTHIEGNPRIIVNKIAYKGSRNLFDKEGKALPTNFETTLANSVYPADMQQMLLLKFKETNMLDYTNELKAEYHDGAQGKTAEKVPTTLKYKFRVVLFGLVEIDGKWEKFFMDISNKYPDKKTGQDDSLAAIFNKEATGVKTRWLNELQVTGYDSFDNPTIQIQPIEQIEVATFKELTPLIHEATKEVLTFINSQVEYAKGKKSVDSNEGKATKGKMKDVSEEENPFPDEE